MLVKFLASKLECESTEYFGAFATPLISQRLSLESVAPSATVWSQFKFQVLTPPNSTPHLGVRVDLGGRKWYQSKSRTNIPIWLLYSLWAYLAPFGHNTQRGVQTTDRAMGKGCLRYSILATQNGVRWGSRNFTHLSGRIGRKNLQYMTSPTVTGHLQNAVKYCTKSMLNGCGRPISKGGFSTPPPARFGGNRRALRSGLDLHLPAHRFPLAPRWHVYLLPYLSYFSWMLKRFSPSVHSPVFGKTVFWFNKMRMLFALKLTFALYAFHIGIFAFY